MGGQEVYRDGVTALLSSSQSVTRVGVSCMIPSLFIQWLIKWTVFELFCSTTSRNLRNSLLMSHFMCIATALGARHHKVVATEPVAS